MIYQLEGRIYQRFKLSSYYVDGGSHVTYCMKRGLCFQVHPEQHGPAKA